MHPTTRVAHPVIWTVLYFPFGALGGFVGVALIFLGNHYGLSIAETSLLGGAQLLSQWLKWSWAPVVDVTWTPKTWYVISTALSALGVFAMSAVPLTPDSLPLLLAIVAVASLVNSMVGMAIEAILAATTPSDELGRTSAWFQAGNLGGYGVGGGVGLLLLQSLPAPWMAGAVMAASFLACIGMLAFVPSIPRTHHATASEAVRGVVTDIAALVRTPGGLLAATLCFVPVGTGAAQGVLTQASVAGEWGAGDHEVALMQGVLAGVITAIGCFGGGWIADRLGPKPAYAAIGLLLAAIAIGMAVCPKTVLTYVVWSAAYSFAVGLAYAAFTAVVLEAIGTRSAATQYNVFASLSNFPIWWLGLVLGQAAQRWGASGMLWTEALIGVAGVALFFGVRRGVLARTAVAAP